MWKRHRANRIYETFFFKTVNEHLYYYKWKFEAENQEQPRGAYSLVNAQVVRKGKYVACVHMLFRSIDLAVPRVEFLTFICCVDTVRPCVTRNIFLYVEDSKQPKRMFCMEERKAKEWEDHLKRRISWSTPLPGAKVRRTAFFLVFARVRPLRL